MAWDGGEYEPTRTFKKIKYLAVHYSKHKPIVVVDVTLCYLTSVKGGAS